MKILYQFLVKDILAYFLMSLGFFLFIFIMEKGLFLSKFLFKNIPISSFGYLLFLSLLPIISFTVPMGFLMAVILSWARLVASSERVAIESCGISIKGLILVTLSFGLCLSICTSLINQRVVPSSLLKFNLLYDNLMKKKPNLLIEEKAFVNLENGDIYVERVDEENLYQIYLTEENRTVFAKKGMVVKESNSLALNLFDGVIHQQDTDLSSYHMLRFSEHNLLLRKIEPEVVSEKKIYHYTGDELLKEAKKHRENPAILTEFHKREAISYACFFFSLVGIGIGLRTKRREKVIGFSASCLIILLYYILFIGCEAFGRKAGVSGLVMWLPNLILLLIGGGMLSVNRRQ
ncbi:LptF/LptG family permease [bacterium]|nr:LptF/LptG family permease [bacterium]